MQEAIEDWRLFTRRMKRRFPGAAFVRVPERHKKGDIHFHAAIFGLPTDLPCDMQKKGKYWIHNCEKNKQCERKTRDLATAWKKGYVDLQKTRKADSIGAYIAKYLTKGDPDWSLFGKHIATFNAVFAESIRAARKAGLLWELNSRRSPVAVDFVLTQDVPRADLRAERTFGTRWLGNAIHRVYEMPGSHASLEEDY